MIVIDIDFFKRVNDTWGHAAGDKAIQAVAQAARACCRGERDVVARMGGEEFALLLYETRVEEGIAVAERLRRQIEQVIIAEGTAEFGITVSCGVAETRANSSYEDLLAEADHALYSAKRDGRNRTHGGAVQQAA